MFTFPTRHVIATAIFLDGGQALRAFLRVGRYPVCRFRVILAFFKPQFDQRTRRWLMIAEATAKTEAMLFWASDRWYNAIEFIFPDITLNRVLTFWCWTPFQHFLVVHIRTGEKNLISSHE